MTKYVTIIGSRETPDDIFVFLSTMAFHLSKDYTIRSGGAEGADCAAELGPSLASWPTNLEIYLPWKKFNKNKSTLVAPDFENFNKAKEIALRLHPSPHALLAKPAFIKLHGRNIYQVLGRDLNTPSSLVLCYTKGGELIGGTSTAIRLAMEWKIPVINLGSMSMEEAHKKIEKEYLSE